MIDGFTSWDVALALLIGLLFGMWVGWDIHKDKVETDIVTHKKASQHTTKEGIDTK